MKGFSQDVNIQQAQRRPPAPPFAKIAKAHDTRPQAMKAAYATEEYRDHQIAVFSAYILQR